MNYITALIDHYLSLPVEKFTDKIISAFQIAEVGDFDKSVKIRLHWIEENTAKGINVSLYMLDRQINPETTGFKRTSNKARFKTTKETYIVIPEEQIQRVLCEAIREVSEIVMFNTKGYNLEFKRNTGNSSKKSIIQFD